MKDILKVINDIIEDEHGEPIQMEDTLVSSGIDSFGVTVLLLELDTKYGKFSKEYLDTVEISKLTAIDIINRING